MKAHEDGLKPPAVNKALTGIDLSLSDGEVLGVLGESGCGKSTLGRALLKLIPSRGRVFWQGKPVSNLSEAAFRPIRRDIQMIFQDVLASLNPYLTIGEAIAEPLSFYEPERSKDSIKQAVLKIMSQTGLGSELYNRYPHEFSGGQCQRVVIARALIAKPKLIICDEPISALDVSIQSQILNLLKELKTRFKLAMIFISHDLSVVRYISNNIMVIYLGKVMEYGPAEQIFKNPHHPYTKALLSAVPMIDPDKEKQRRRIHLSNDLPSPFDLPAGCVFLLDAIKLQISASSSHHKPRQPTPAIAIFVIIQKA